MEFGEFWRLYPRKIARKAALKVWDKMSAEDQAQALTAIPNHVRAWRGTDPQYIPHARTWLNQERWTDEIDAPKKSPVERLMEAMNADHGTISSSGVHGDDQPVHGTALLQKMARSEPSDSH